MVIAYKLNRSRKRNLDHDHELREANHVPDFVVFQYFVEVCASDLINNQWLSPKNI